MDFVLSLSIDGAQEKKRVRLVPGDQSRQFTNAPSAT
jgi:hypothetical protein